MTTGPTAAPREITLLTQADCALCVHAKQVLEKVGADHPLTVTEIDLGSEEGQRLAMQAQVLFAPGILLDGRPFAYGRLSERRLRRALTTTTATNSRTTDRSSA